MQKTRLALLLLFLFAVPLPLAEAQVPSSQRVAVSGYTHNVDSDRAVPYGLSLVVESTRYGGAVRLATSFEAGLRAGDTVGPTASTQIGVHFGRQGDPIGLRVLGGTAMMPAGTDLGLAVLGHVGITLKAGPATIAPFSEVTSGAQRGEWVTGGLRIGVKLPD